MSLSNVFTEVKEVTWSDSTLFEDSIAAEFASAMDHKRVLDVTREVLEGKLGYRLGAFYLVENGKIKPLSGVWREELDDRPRDQDILRYAAVQGRILNRDRVVEVSTHGHCFLVSISELIVPVRLRGVVGAVFSVESRGGAFSESDLDVIKSLAHLVAQALDR